MFKTSEVIAIIDIFVNALLIILVAIYIQKTQINSRTLKDYFIKEVDKLHYSIAEYLDSLEEGNFIPMDVQNWFMAKISLINNLSEILFETYKFDLDDIVNDLLFLQFTIENDQNYLANFISNSPVSLTGLTLQEIQHYRAQKVKIFHKKVLNINNFTKFM